MQQTSIDLYERIVTMLEGALYHQENAGASLDDAYAYTPVRREFDSF